MSRSTIVAICGDPGGAAAVAPVIHALRQRSTTVRLFAYGQASTYWAQRGLTFEAVDDTLSTAGALDRLRAGSADLVLAGTSMNALMLEHQFIAAARLLGIPSLSVLDFWLNYAERFSSSGLRLAHLPDRIAVMDERACAEMVAQGFERSRLAVTGQPAFDDLSDWRAGFAESRRQQRRRQWGIGGNELAVLFVSQPFSALYGADGDPLHYGFDEHLVLSLLLDALERIARNHRAAFTVIVRPHPREDADGFGADDRPGVRVVVSSDGEAREAALAADLVTGMNSVVLMEACYLQCLTVSLQPGLRRADVLPTNRPGFSRPVYLASEVHDALEELLFDDGRKHEVRQQLQSLVAGGGAASRVVALIEQMLVSRGGVRERDNVNAGD